LIKDYCIDLIGKNVIDKTMKRIGIIESIVFNNKDFSICWFNFKWEKGAYLRSTNEIELIQSKYVQLELF
jgi:sporulation protein YlmC with PRC-barrel domain